MANSKFQFKGFTIGRSLIEIKNDNASEKLSIKFDPKGFINRNENKFRMELGVKISDENKSFKIDIQAIANYEYEKVKTAEELDNFFYINAPAILFPYIRAYISTISNLSGFKPINLPTLNIMRIGEDLKKNTVEV